MGSGTATLGEDVERAFFFRNPFHDRTFLAFWINNDGYWDNAIPSVITGNESGVSVTFQNMPVIFSGGAGDDDVTYRLSANELQVQYMGLQRRSCDAEWWRGQRHLDALFGTQLHDLTFTNTGSSGEVTGQPVLVLDIPQIIDATYTGFESLKITSGKGNGPQ